MLKKRVLKRLLPLLFSFCCVFSGFLSVNAFAFTIPLSSVIVRPDVGIDEQFFIQNDVGTQFFIDCVYDSGEFSTEFHLDTTYTNVPRFGFILNSTDFSYTFNHESFDYYLGFNVFFKNSCNYSVNRMSVRTTHTDGYLISFDLSDVNFSNNHLYNGSIYKSYVSAIGKIPEDIAQRSINQVNVYGNGSLPAGTYNEFTCYLYQVPKGTDVETVNSLISAINNQTGALQGSIGQAADDVQQSIEDQYSGDPEEEFSVDDVISQHNEKMGVLSFGSDVMLQFLDMFQSANVGTAELTLPGFNITVENVEYSVWPDYSFNFEQLNEWVPALMSVIRVMLPAFVWLMVLRYCIKVFEDNFLAK